MSQSWGDLLPGVGCMILDKLTEVVENIRFGAVCKQWCEISREYRKLLRPNRKFLPMLLVPSPDGPAKSAPPCLYALSCFGKYYSNINLQVPFNNERYCGSSYGWIAIQNEDRTITLIYPFGESAHTIHLPGIVHWARPTYCFLVEKVFLSPNSTRDGYTVVAIYGGSKELATLKSGDKSWEYIPPRPEAAPASLFNDVIFYQGGVYAVSKVCMFVKLDIHARPPTVEVLHPLNRKTQFTKTYLVESTSSNLFLLQRRCINFYPHKDIATVGFNVFELKLHGKKTELIDRKDFKSLNGDTFFVGDSTSLAVQSHGCRANSIYFTDDLHDPGYYKPSGPVDIGCHSVEDETVTSFYRSNPAHKNDVARPTWISPRQDEPLPLLEF